MDQHCLVLSFQESHCLFNRVGRDDRISPVFASDFYLLNMRDAIDVSRKTAGLTRLTTFFSFRLSICNRARFRA